MTLWRISNHADLSGLGGVHRSGRWHFAGVPVVYLAESPALALLEVVVNFDLKPDELPADYQLLEVDCASVSTLSVDDGQLGHEWANRRSLTQSVGSEWLMGGASALLKVPSAVVPKSWNHLLNPRHPDAAHAAIRSSTRHPFDRRLIRNSHSD